MTIIEKSFINDRAVGSSGRSPMFSPDGQKLAYVALSRSTMRIHLVDRDGTNLLTLTEFDWEINVGAGLLSYPSLRWSPDGSKLLFNIPKGDQLHLYIINSDGSGLMQVTSLEGALDVSPSWSR